jgi:hypothetical protein
MYEEMKKVKVRLKLAEKDYAERAVKQGRGS